MFKDETFQSMQIYGYRRPAVQSVYCSSVEVSRQLLREDEECDS